MMNTEKKFPQERIIGSESMLKVAAIQTNPVFGQKIRNVTRQIELIKKAAKDGNKLIVTPELGNTGYVFNSREELFELAEIVPDGETCQKWIQVCKEESIYLCCGITEREGNLFYNSAVLIGPDGFIGKYRKNHLWDEDKLWFEPGNLGFPVFNLPFGRVGMLICYDGWHPEVPRIYALQGVDILCDPSAWVVVPGVVTAEKPLSAYLHLANAHFSNIFMICSDRTGSERGATFLGNSCIAGPNGFINGPASLEKEEIVSAEINILDARRKHWSSFAKVLADRRTDLYDEYLGYDISSRKSKK